MSDILFAFVLILYKKTIQGLLDSVGDSLRDQEASNKNK